MKNIKLILLLILIILPNVYSHPGGTASDGCHYCRTNCDKWGVPWNERHCHNKPTTEESPVSPPTETTTQETTSNSQNELESTQPTSTQSSEDSYEPTSQQQLLENLQRKREEQIEQGLIQQPKKQCNGCLNENTCLQYGSRLIKDAKLVYCDFNKEFKIQKQNNEQCQNNYECLSNSCGNGVCQNINERIQSIEQELKEQRSLLQKILDFFSRIFGG